MIEEIDITASMYPEQREFVRDIFSGNYSKVVTSAGRRAGKSYCLDRISIGLCFRKRSVEVLWCTPSHSQSQEAFERIQEILTAVKIPFKPNASSSDRRITFENGSKIKFKSAEKFNNLRGNNPDYVILDEFAFFKDEAYQKAIEPYMISNEDLVIIAASTFNGKNDFYAMWEDGNNPKNTTTKTHRLHYSMNPITNYAFIEEKRKSLPKQVFDQEYEGIPVFGSSSVFGDFGKLQSVTKWAKYDPDETYFFAIDVSGKGSDKTQLCIMNGAGKVVRMYEVDAPTGKNKEQVKELVPIMLQYKKMEGYVEVNGLGEGFAQVLEDELEGTDVNVNRLFSTNDIKQKMVSKFLLCMEDDTGLELPTSALFPQLDVEMSMYCVNRTSTGMLTYSHPKGSTTIHDDAVDATLMCNWARYNLICTGGGMVFENGANTIGVDMSAFISDDDCDFI